MDRIPALLILLVLFLGVLALMRLGWRNRARRHADLPEPEPIDPAAELELGPFEAVYVSTVLAGQPFERVVAHGLGTRSRARVAVTAEGDWRIERHGATSFTVPARSISDVAPAPGMSGKVIGGDGLVVVRWRLGPRELDTGLRLRSRSDHDLLLTRKDTT